MTRNTQPHAVALGAPRAKDDVRSAAGAGDVRLGMRVRQDRFSLCLIRPQSKVPMLSAWNDPHRVIDTRRRRSRRCRQTLAAGSASCTRTAASPPSMWITLPSRGRRSRSSASTTTS